MKARTKARGIALQVLYEVDLTGHLPSVVLSERLEDTPLEISLANFSRDVVFGVLGMVHELDNFIAQHAPEWPLDQVATIDRNILRIALWEFGVQGKTPIKVVINEAIELSKEFGSDSTPRFVNGVLGSLADRKNEINQAFRSFRK